MATREQALNAYNEGFCLGLRPDSLLSVSEWADKYRILPKRSSTEPGRFRVSRTPYMKEIMDALSVTSDVERVVFMKPTQIGATEGGCCWFGYITHLCPGPMMMILPTIEMAKKHSKQKIAPTIEETQVLRERIKESRSRDSGNTTLMKEFTGGMLILNGANSGTSFRNVSIRFLHASDIDGYPQSAGDEGDPLSLAINRCDAYGNRKIYIESTPTKKETSRIAQEYEDSDQRKYYVPCPHCHEKQVLMWSGIVFEHKEYKLEGEVKYRCLNCGTLIEEYHKTSMLESGEWIPSNPGHQTRGYWLNSLYSPLGWLSWAKIVTEFLHAKKHNDRELFQHWTNTRLAETFEEDGERVSDSVLFNRREKYGPEIPEQVVILTAGVDDQGDRLEIGVTGWGASEESWDIEYKVLWGDPSKPEVWQHLKEFLSKQYKHTSGYTWRISSTAIDTGGHHTKQVYDFVRPLQSSHNLWAIKGSNQHGVPIISKPSKNIPGIFLYHIGTDTAKNLLFGRLRIENPGPGYMHFPMELDEEYFKQLTAEKKITKKRMGFEYTEWEKTRARNESLDCKIYSIAALYIAVSRHYPNNTVSQALERMANKYKADVTEIEKKIPAPDERPRRRLLSKVEIYS